MCMNLHWIHLNGSSTCSTKTYDHETPRETAECPVQDLAIDTPQKYSVLVPDQPFWSDPDQLARTRRPNVLLMPTRMPGFFPGL